MATLSDEERQFLLKATGLSADATLNDLRYAYFLGVNSGKIGGRAIPAGGSLENVLAIANTATGELKWLTATVNPTPDTVAKRSAGGRLLVGAPTGVSDATTKAYVDAAISALNARVTALETPPAP